MIDDIIVQVEQLMKDRVKDQNRTNPYFWLCNKKSGSIRKKDDIAIRRITKKLPGKQLSQAFKDLNLYVQVNEVNTDEIPQIFIDLLGKENDLYLLGKINNEKRVKLQSNVLQTDSRFFYMYYFFSLFTSKKK